MKNWKLTTQFLVLMLFVASISLCAYGLWSYEEQQRQTESRMLEEARVLNNAIQAAWDFIDNEQEVINYDRDGEYNFKGIYCSLVGKSIGRLFSMSTDYDYSLRYTRIAPRNVADEPDGFEQAALDYFLVSDGAEHFDVTENVEGERVFRYVAKITLTESCLECHGGPAGELDVTGNPKEGLAVGDMGGAVSITMPMARHDADIQSNTWRMVSFFVILAFVVALISALFFRKKVIKPLAQLEDATTEMGKGNLSVDLEGIDATREMNDFVEKFQGMAAELDDLYRNLETKVENRTQQYQEANSLLEEQGRQIAEANALLQRVNSQLMEENEYHSNFLAMVSHEFRTPLTAIMAYTELWQNLDDPESSEGLECVTKIKAASHSLLEMVNNTLDVARFEAGNVDLIIEDVDLVDLISDVEQIANPLARNKNIELTTRVDFDVPVIKSDWDQLRKIMINIVSNAIKFTDSDGTVSIRVKHNAADHAILITTKDSGIGISDEKMESIFDKFVQADNTSSRRYGGTGLGLSLVKMSAEMLGGSVGVESTVGVGSTFTIRLPIREETDGS